MNKYCLVILSCVLLFSSCYYNYGVNKLNLSNEFNINSEKEKNKFEFKSVLYYDETNSKPFIIEIQHLSKINNIFRSTIRIQDYYPNQNKVINFGNIVVKHSVKDNELISSKTGFKARRNYSENSEVLPLEYVISKDDSSIYIEYYKDYKIEKSYKNITEYIYIELYIDKEKHVIEYEFPIEYKLETTKWKLLKFLYKTG